MSDFFSKSSKYNDKSTDKKLNPLRNIGIKQAGKWSNPHLKKITKETTGALVIC